MFSFVFPFFPSFYNFLSGGGTGFKGGTWTWKEWEICETGLHEESIKKC